MIKITLCLLFLVIPVISCFPQQPKTAQQSQEESGSYAWDFGKVREGEVLKHEFVLKNDTLHTLNIKRLYTSCGCTVSAVKKNKLLPGESTLIEVSFNTRGYSGPVKQYVYLETDNLDNSIIRYIIKADVVK